MLGNFSGRIGVDGCSGMGVKDGGAGAGLRLFACLCVLIGLRGVVAFVRLFQDRVIKSGSSFNALRLASLSMCV